LEPDQLPLAVHEVALDETQVTVEELPLVTDVGAPEIVTVGVDRVAANWEASVVSNWQTPAVTTQVDRASPVCIQGPASASARYTVSVSPLLLGLTLIAIVAGCINESATPGMPNCTAPSATTPDGSVSEDGSMSVAVRAVTSSDPPPLLVMAFPPLSLTESEPLCAVTLTVVVLADRDLRSGARGIARRNGEHTASEI